jgi:hypothetical protein
MHFQREGYTTFEIKDFSITARPALGGAFFTVHVQGRTEEYGDGAMLLSGRLQFDAIGNNTCPWPVFDFTHYYAQPRALRKNCPDSLCFEGMLSYSQLEAFEKRRNGNDFDVSLYVSLHALRKQGLENWNIQGGSLKKPAQEWLKILQQAGYKNYLFHELAFPADAIVRPNSAFQHLLNAREHFDSGLYKECIVALRGVEEQLRKNRKDEDKIKRVTKLFKDDRESMKFSERALFLRNAVNNAMNSAAHIGEQEKSFDRPTAKALLIMMSALVELYPEPNS